MSVYESLRESGEIHDILADYAHDAWSRWMSYLFSVSVMNQDGSVTISVDKVGRWSRQMTTKYVDLSEREQVSDLREAQRIVEAIESKETPNA